jgi:ankyrin repeat protein
MRHERSLEEIDEQNWEYAHRLFQCVAAASRPLFVHELAEFLAFDFEAGSTPTFLADWRPEDPGHTVLSVCSSLLAVIKPRGGSPVVQFAHFSVKEYLTSARLAKAKDSISRFHVSTMTAAHTVVVQACLGVLLHLDETVTKDSLENFPLAEYAAKHWVYHARFENVSSNVQDGIKRLFDPSKSHLLFWVWVRDPEYRSRRFERSERPTKARATPLHYAAFCGLHDIVAFLVVEHSQDVNTRGFNKKETPLHVASRRGHVEVAQLLLELGADAEAQDHDRSTPLLLASKDGLAEVTRVLLGHGADIEARDHEHRTPLLLASGLGHVEVSRVLLEHGADMKAQDKFKRTALHRAQREDVARLLLKHGADANALDIKGRTPLHHASDSGRVGIAKVLLDHGIDVNARDANNQTPLHLASRTRTTNTGGGDPDIVRLLLQYSSDIHARDNKGQTPFMMATAARNHGVIQLLSESGAEDHRT